VTAAIHHVGDRVQNLANGWFGTVYAVECVLCGAQIVRGKCPSPHKTRRLFYFITVGQDNVPGDRRPWCNPKAFPRVSSRKPRHPNG
jgi:hypothetical protein